MTVADRIRFKFDSTKAVEAILYIANRVKEPTFHRISKIFYFADRGHIANYGRFICGDDYVAMAHGPVPSGIYEILKHVRGDGLPIDIKNVAELLQVKDGKTVIPARDAVRELLSESERECLDAAIKQYGSLSFTKLTEVSHDAAWKSADENDLIKVEEIVATLPNSKELLQHLTDPFPE